MVLQTVAAAACSASLCAIVGRHAHTTLVCCHYDDLVWTSEIVSSLLLP